jgi:uncharacterized protein (TIGR02099 family)
VAVISSLFRALTPLAKQYKTEVEQHLSTVLGEPVKIRSMETGWYWFYPVIQLKQVDIKGEQQKLIQLKKVLIGINLFSSLWHWQIQPGILYIDDLDLSIRQKEGGWMVDGLKVGSNTQIPVNASSLKPVLAWILNQRKIIIKNLSASIYFKDGFSIPIKNLDLTAVSKSGKYHIHGKAILAQSPGSAFQILAEMDLSSYSLEKSSGRVFFSVDDLNIAQWRHFLPPTSLGEIQGYGSAQWWFDWKAGVVKKIQARVNFQDLLWQDPSSKKNEVIQKLTANLAWMPMESGWKLLVDHLGLRLNSIVWPENNLSVIYKKSLQTYELYVKHINIHSLLSSYSNWPSTFESIIQTQPQGLLEDMQCHIQDREIQYLLTKFKNLGWHKKSTLPGVKNLSGVIHWQPEEGRLELDSNNAVLSIEDKLPIYLAVLNGAVDWKKLSHGLRIGMERLVLQRPDLVLTARGSIDEVTKESVAQMDFKAEISADKVEQWIPYIPEGKLKPKMEAWIKDNIKHVGNLVAEVNMNGAPADFPFDNKKGEFLLKSHIRSMDLYFAKNWPLNTNVEAYLNINKRAYNMDVVQADMGGMQVKNMNLNVDDVGLGKENLLIHAKIATEGEKGLDYLQATPLAKKTSHLNKLQIQGNLNLDLQLEIPLYSGKEEILTLGDLEFDKNMVSVKHPLKNFDLDDVTGSFHFDQTGILGSNLNATILGYPASIFIQSIYKPKPATEIKILGETTIDTLKNMTNLPLLSLMKGSMPLESVLILSDKPGDFDHMEVKSSLQGVAINLPPPFDKNMNSITPLQVDIDFNPDKGMHLGMNYDSRISSIVKFNKNLNLERGEIRFGNKAATLPDKKGLKLAGVVPAFKIEPWYAAMMALPKTQENSLLDTIKTMDLNLESVQFSDREYKKIKIKAGRIENQDWNIQFDQQFMAGNIDYLKKSNSIIGTFERLHLPKDSKQSGKPLLSGMRAKTIPNLDIKVNDFKFGNWDLGEMMLKGISQDKAWKLDHLKLSTPYYQIFMQGNWTDNKKESSTSVKAYMDIKNLAKSLERWNINPVVEASSGKVQFNGTWPGGFHDFSVKTVNGELGILLRNGQITHLSKETEEKLGLGKLLSVLSLQTIPRRLKLDFSDLSNKGYTFDTFSGNFRIGQGMMTTRNSYIDGPIAYASMKGNLDIARQLYNLDLKVSPHITASLPIVATIAGGPIAGIATWAASKIINQGMQTVTGYSYKITGPWKQPVVQQLSITSH